MKTKLIQTLSILIVCVILGALIAIQMKNVNALTLTETNLQALQQQVINYQLKNEALNNRNSELYQQIEQLERHQQSGAEVSSAIIQEKERAALFAGLREVENAGVVLTFTPKGTTQMRDTVLRLFVNELTALGAQAISINGERKVAMTEIRNAVDVIIINGNGYSRTEPFEIKAITDPAKEKYILDYLGTLRQSVLKDLESDSVEINIQADTKIKIPALSEDSVAFKMDLLKPVSTTLP